MKHLLLMAVAIPLLLGACTSRRLLVLENRVLRQENVELRARADALQLEARPTVDYLARPTLTDIGRWLDRAGYAYTVTEGAESIRLEYAGRYTDFGIDIQHFANAEVLFVAVTDYLSLEDVHDVDTTTLLLVQLAILNYEMLLGKLQLDPQSGDVLLSVELHLDDGLGYLTFVHALEHLMQTADDRHRLLEQVVQGDGI